LTGENDFGRQAELDKLAKAFVAKHGDLALERLDGQEAAFEQIREALTSLPFLAAHKMVILREPGANKQFAADFEKISSEIPETNDVILIEPKLDKRLSYYKFLKKQTDFREFSELDAAGLTRWLAQAVKARGGSLSSADARYLVERVGPNQQLTNSTSCSYMIQISTAAP